MSSSNKPTRLIYTYEATLPKGIDLEKSYGQAVLVAADGKQYRLQRAGYAKSNPGDDRFSLTFELPFPSSAQRILVGRYQIDVHHSQIVDTQAAR